MEANKSSISAQLLKQFTNAPLRIATKNKDGEVISFEIFADSNGIIHINHNGSNLQKGENHQIGIVFKTWWIGLHWFVKSEDKRHTIPRKGVKKPKIYEPTGLYLKRIFTLCEGCQSRRSLLTWDLESYNPISWFWLILKEIVTEDIFSVLNQDETGVRKILEIHNVSCPDRNLKRGYIRGVLLPGVLEAENYRNPYDSESFSGEEWVNSGYTYRAILLESAIKLAQGLSGFNVQYYQPFIKAWRDSISVMESPDYCLLQMKKGCLHVQNGKSTLNLSEKYQ